jgi:hypothetical protein
MYNRIISFVLLFFTLIPVLTAHAEEISTTVLEFRDQDMPTEEPYITRMIVNDDFLRLDDGDDHGDFALFDRKKKTIYSVTHDNQRILVIPPRDVSMAPPTPFRHDVEQVDAGDVPDIDGKKVSKYYLFTNGKRCMQVYAVPGYLENVSEALSGFLKTLAGQHAQTAALMPDDLRNECDLANNIFLPDRHLGKGFPVRTTDFTGRSRALVNVRENVQMGPAIFELPVGYQKFMPGGLPH